MLLYVIRHAIADERDPARWPDDAQRPLVERGRRRFEPVADVLGRVAPDIDALLSSRFVRAWQTAGILSERAGWPDPIALPALEMFGSEEVCEAIELYSTAEMVAVVGHEPCLGELVSYLLTGNEDRLDLEMKKGGAVCISIPGAPGPGTGTLCWSLTPRLARAVSSPASGS